MILACPIHLLPLSAVSSAFLPHIRNIIKTKNNPSNRTINGKAAIPMDAPPSHSMQVVPCLTYPAAHTKHNVPAYSFLHCALVCLNVVLLHIDVLDVILTGQQRSSANSCASKEEYPTTQGEKVSVVKSGLQYPGLAVSSASASPSLVEQSAPIGHFSQDVPLE